VLLRSDSLLPIAEMILFLPTMHSPQRMPLRSTYQQMMFQTGFTAKTRNFVSLCDALSTAREPWGGEHEFTAIVMRACASCSRDVIATVYRLRVVIATPRIELGEFRCNAGLIEIWVPDAAQAGHVDCGFRLPQSMAVDYCSMRVNADQTIRPGRRT
jgi:hypothetical protein